MSNINFKQLQDQISSAFDEEELRGLCHDLGIDYESLGGRGKAANVRELVAYCQRHNRLADLQTALMERRDWIDWPSLFAPHLSPLSSSPLHHLPFQRNPNFSGRESWLAQLQRHFGAETTTPIIRVISGLGGMGKTQVALEYCYRHRDAYGLIYWLNADDVPALSEGLAGLAYALWLAQPGAGEQEAALAGGDGTALAAGL